MTPKLTVKNVWLSERPVDFRLPFRFGDVTVTCAPQAFVRVEIELDGKRSTGASAELMVPKWFDKNPALSIEQTIDQLRCSLALARDSYLVERRAETAFGLHAAVYPGHIKACAGEAIPPLAAAYGLAEIDKAVVDALLRALRVDVFAGLAANVVGLDARLTPDLDQYAIDHFLASREPQSAIDVRHTVGITDPVGTLLDVVRRHGCRYFKIKLCGDPGRDISRLESLAVVLDSQKLNYLASLDANEQYADASRLLELVARLFEARHLAEFHRRILYIEQPLPRELTWQTPLGEVGKRLAFIVDEADDGYDAFPNAVKLGYCGISSKSCKGIYKSLLNGARSAAWNAAGQATFITAEDLTCQAGLAVQQDTALAAFLGCTHIERNGHHYVDGFADTPKDEAAAFLTEHPDLYCKAGDGIRLRIANGALSFGSLRVTGFACGAGPANRSFSSVNAKLTAAAADPGGAG
jgi:hypothetical protein